MTDRADAMVMVTAYLVALGFSETHADEIAHEMVRAHLDADAAVHRAVSSGQMFAFDTLDGMADFAEAFEPSDDDDEYDDDERAGPTEMDRAARAYAAAKAKARARAPTEHAKTAEERETRWRRKGARHPPFDERDDRETLGFSIVVRGDARRDSRAIRRRVLRRVLPSRRRAAVRFAHGG